MKRFSILAFFLLLAATGFSQTTQLIVNYQFKNVEDGYDHDCKTKVFIDDNEVGVSKVAKQTKGGVFTVQVPAGTHELKVVNWALYEGEWEEHTIENNYSIDALFSTNYNFKKPSKLFLIFDLDSGTYASWNKPPKGKGKGKK